MESKVFEHIQPNISNPDYWDGGLSKVNINGPLENYIVECLKNHDCSFIISRNDGIVKQENYDNLWNSLTRQKRIVGALCTRNISGDNILLLPLDDDTFNVGLRNVINHIPNIPWEQRLPKAFWRGGSSGGYPSIRTQTTELLHNYENADVKLTVWGNWQDGKPIPPEHFGDRCGLEKHFFHKYILILDGNVIASNHQWVFGSGAVPILVTHPLNKFWFKKYLRPMVNYVPVNYDLSDLKEKIEWLINNDNEAKQIMMEAMSLADIVFSSDFQKQHIKHELDKILENE